jgi:nucleotide-binding universal stress UspA family protein
MDMSVVHGSVVVGVDGSEPAAAALDWAVRQSALEGRTLTVVHACGVPGVMQDFEDIVAHERGLRSVGRSIAREAVREARLTDPTIGVESVVTMGHPETVLVEASESADMLVVGARGRGTVASALLGSVSATVARESHCPVIIVRTFEEPLEEGAEEPQVVVGVDGTPVSSAAVEFAFRMASERGAPLTLLHATWDLREQASSVVDLRSYAEKVNLNEEEERLVAETVAGLCEKYPDVAVTETYRRGEPVRQLVEASRTASLVVVGSRGRRLLATTLLGSVSRGVAERAYCPVAVVRP